MKKLYAVLIAGAVALTLLAPTAAMAKTHHHKKHHRHHHHQTRK